MADSFVEVVLRWGRDVVEVRKLVEERTLTVGRLPSDDLFVPLEHAESHPLLVRSASGWLLTTAPGMRGIIERAGRAVPLCAEIGATVLVDDDVSATVGIGAFTLEVRRADRSRVAALAPIFDALWANTATVTLFAMAAFVAMFTLVPRAVDDDAAALAVTAARFGTVIARVTPPARAPSASPTSSPSSPSAPSTPSPSSPSSPRAPRAAAQAAAQPRRSDEDVVEGRLAALFGGPGGLSSVVGDDRFEQVAGLVGSIDGATATTAPPGLGLQGRARSGDGGAAGVGIIGIGAVDTGRGRARGNFGAVGGDIGAKRDYEVVVQRDPAVVVGALDREIIRRVVRAHVDQVRACYERALLRTPGLEGKVSLAWVIGPSGRVRSARVSAGSGDASLDGCVARHVRTWVFPAPKGGGDVVVTYPFVVRPAG